jgi:hypothetical protein
MKMIEVSMNGFVTLMDADKLLMVERREKIVDESDSLNYTAYFPNMRAGLTKQTFEEIEAYFKYQDKMDSSTRAMMSKKLGFGGPQMPPLKEIPSEEKKEIPSPEKEG